MSKKALVSVLFSCCFLGSFADNAVKQVVQIAGQTQQEAVKSLTFSGNEVTVTFRNGLTTVAWLDSLTISVHGNGDSDTESRWGSIAERQWILFAQRCPDKAGRPRSLYS